MEGLWRWAWAELPGSARGRGRPPGRVQSPPRAKSGLPPEAESPFGCRGPVTLRTDLRSISALCPEVRALQAGVGAGSATLLQPTMACAAGDGSGAFACPGRPRSLRVRERGLRVVVSLRGPCRMPYLVGGPRSTHQPSAVCARAHLQMGTLRHGAAQDLP